MEEQVLYRPRDLYEKTLRGAYHQGASDYFDELVKKSGTDVSGNAVHVKAYEDAAAKEKALREQTSNTKTAKGFTIAGMILFYLLGTIFFLAGLFDVTNGAASHWYFILIGAFSIVGGVALTVLLVKSINAKLQNQEAEVLAAAKDTQAKLKICYQDTIPLCNSFDWNIPGTVMEKATPIIDLDPYFKTERYCYLRDKFGLKESDDPHESVLGVISGQIQGNPFLLERVRKLRIGSRVYTGSIVIHWTTTYHDKDGTHVEHHTQTLVAQVSKPAPYYSESTFLVYGNEAAPHLHFSRSPSGASSMSKEEQERAVKKGAKELSKKAENDLKAGKERVFTPMGNDAFDVFFGATDRDNEVEFRLLYTPLAQENIVDLVTNPLPYGDDFYMVKDGMVNSVASAHSQRFDYSADPSRFQGFSVEQMKKDFVSYCDSYIASLYFDLAPLLSVPLYQMHKPHEYIYQDDYPGNFTSYEHESLANAMDADLFRPLKAGKDLPLMIKSSKVSRKGQQDEVIISAYSFTETPRVSYIAEMGGDGRLHSVPVHWISYRAVRQDSALQVSHTDLSGPEFVQKESTLSLSPHHHYERGLIAEFIEQAGQTLKEGSSSLSIQDDDD